jgi:hypothetical protein
MFPGGHGYILNRAKHDISKNALMFEIGRACGTEDIKFEDVVIICHKCGKQTIHPVKMDYCINPNCV